MMAIKRKEEGVITVNAGSSLETFEAFSTTMRELDKIFSDKYNKNINPTAALPIPLGKTNSMFAILFYNMMDVAKYGVLPYSKKLADAGMMGERCLVTGSDGELYKLKLGGQAGVDPATDDGSSWDKYGNSNYKRHTLQVGNGSIIVEKVGRVVTLHNTNLLLGKTIGNGTKLGVLPSEFVPKTTVHGTMVLGENIPGSGYNSYGQVGLVQIRDTGVVQAYDNSSKKDTLAIEGINMTWIV